MPERGRGRENFLQTRTGYREALAARAVSTKTIKDILRQQAGDAERAVREIFEAAGSTNQGRMRALQNSEATLQRMIDDAFSEAGRQARSGARAASRGSAQSAAAISDFLTRNMDARDAARVQSATRRSSQRASEAYLSRANVDQVVDRNRAVASQRLRRQIRQGISKGQTPNQISKQVARSFNPNTRGGLSYQARRMVDTEVQRAFTGTSRAWHGDVPFVEAVRWKLSPSHPREDICDDLAQNDDHGLGAGIYPAGEEPDTPHPNCGCYTIEITPQRDEFAERVSRGDYDAWLTG